MRAGGGRRAAEAVTADCLITAAAAAAVTAAAHTAVAAPARWSGHRPGFASGGGVRSQCLLLPCWRPRRVLDGTSNFKDLYGSFGAGGVGDGVWGWVAMLSDLTTSRGAGSLAS